MVDPIGPNFNTVNIYLVVQDSKAAIKFYEAAFGGQAGACLVAPDGSVMHATVRIGNSTVMLSDENPDFGMSSPDTLGGSAAHLMLYVPDCDAVFQQAIEAGCSELSPPMDMFWGDRHCKVADPFGYQWGIATRIEELTDEEVQERADKWIAENMTGDA